MKTNDMKNYIVKSFHDVYVDDYNEGEGDYVNSYALSGEVQANTPNEAVTAYLRDNLGYNLDFNNCEVSPEEVNRVQTSCLVDADNMQPDNSMYEQWKAGKLECYSNHIDMFVYEVISVSF